MDEQAIDQLAFLDPEVEAFYKGRYDDIETGIVEGEKASLLVRPTADRDRSDIESFLEGNGYETGRPIAFKSYELEIDREGLGELLEEGYVEAVEMVRPLHLPDGISEAEDSLDYD